MLNVLASQTHNKQKLCSYEHLKEKSAWETVAVIAEMGASSYSNFIKFKSKENKHIDCL